MFYLDIIEQLLEMRYSDEIGIELDREETALLDELFAAIGVKQGYLGDVELFHPYNEDVRALVMELAETFTSEHPDSPIAHHLNNLFESLDQYGPVQIRNHAKGYHSLGVFDESVRDAFMTIADFIERAPKDNEQVVAMLNVLRDGTDPLFYYS